MSLDIFEKEEIATEKRFWLRTIRRCNNHCIFCHDSEVQNGEIIPIKNLKMEIDNAKKGGYTRLILSGGEPTIHPNIIELIGYAKKKGFEWVQIISNGRMFAYPSFTADVVKAGLNEVTISLHSHIEEIADKLTDIKGSFVQTIAGIKNLKKYNLVISIDIVLNRLNVKHIKDTIDFFFKNFGITEFDLLHLTPFGRAHKNYDELIISPEEEYNSLKKAIRYAHENKIVLWTNRVPPNLLEGNENFIQDPHKILDEIYGRRDIFNLYLRDGVLECREKIRCNNCFVRDFCEFVIEIRSTFLKKRIERLELSNKSSPEIIMRVFDHLTYNATILVGDRLIEYIKDEIRGSQKQLIIKMDNTEYIEKLINDYRIYALISEHPEITKIKGLRLILILSNKNYNKFIPQKNLILLYPNQENMKDEFERVLEIKEVKMLIDRYNIRIANLPKCIAKDHYRDNSYFFKSEFIVEDGFDLFEIAKDFLLNKNYHKSLRCIDCIHNLQCKGMHINHIRRFGFKILRPVKL